MSVHTANARYTADEDNLEATWEWRWINLIRDKDSNLKCVQHESINSLYRLWIRNKKA